MEEIKDNIIENNYEGQLNILSIRKHKNNLIAKSKLDEMNPITILGRKYINEEEFLKDIYSKIWLTYRFGFEPILKSKNGPSPLSFITSMIFNKNLVLNNFQNFIKLIESNNFTSDVGWGCMVRTSQNLLASTYLQMAIGKNFRFNKNNLNLKHLNIIKLFKDNLNSPFSLHNFIKVASELPLKMKPGEWFGPNAASLSIQKLCDNLNNSDNLLVPILKVLISETCDLYDNEIIEIFSNSSNNSNSSSNPTTSENSNNKILNGLLILLPIRLGIDKVNSFYQKSLLHLLSLEQCVGIAGGKPSSSFYFLGYQNNDLIYLDPHYPQEFLNEIKIETYHTKKYYKLNINDLDPSMMVGILINSHQDFEEFKIECIKNENKIIHFHENQDNSFYKLKKKFTNYFNSNINDSIDDDGSVYLSNKSKDFDEFIDLGDELNELNEMITIE